MTNKQIIRAAAERLDPATLHQIATAHHTPEEIAAVAASCKIVDKDGNEKPATAAEDRKSTRLNSSHPSSSRMPSSA